MLDGAFKDELLDGVQELIERLEMADEMSLDDGNPFYVLLGGVAFEEGIIQNLIIPNSMPPAAVKLVLKGVLESDMLNEHDQIT